MAVNAGVSALLAIAGGLLAGVLVDRYDPRRVLIAAEVFAVPSVLALAVPESIWPFVALSGIAGFAGGFIMTSVASFAPYLARGDALPRTNAAIEVASALAMVLGPAAGGAIAKWFGIDGVFVMDAITSVVAVGLLAPIRVRAVDKGARATAGAELREGLRFAARDPAVRLYLVSGAAVWFTFGAFSALEALFYRDVLHSGPAMIGWVLSLFGAALFVGSMTMPRLPRKLITARVLAALMVVMACGEMVYVATGNLVVVIAGNTVWGIAMGAFWPMLRTLVQTATPERLVGRVMGSSVTLNRAAQVTPLIFVGAVAAIVGVQRVLVGAGAILILIAIAGYAEAVRVDASVREAPVVDFADPTIAEPATRGVI
jgi:predicted MFS family arabinose efflux permease